MICPKCGGSNLDGSTFCVKCGVALKEVASSENIDNNASTQINTNNSTAKKDYKEAAMGFFAYAISAFMKPFNSFKNEKSKLADNKNSFMFAGFIVIVMMLVTLVTRMISSIFYKNFFNGKYVFEISNLKNLNYLNLILKNLLIYACILVFIAGVYYIVSLIFKKNSSFSKLLNVTSTSIIPFVVLSMFAPTILAYIWNPLAIVSFVIGLIYSLVIFINLIDEVMSFESKDMKIYFHTICFAIIIILGGYIIYRSVLSSVSGAFSGLF